MIAVALDGVVVDTYAALRARLATVIPHLRDGAPAIRDLTDFGANLPREVAESVREIARLELASTGPGSVYATAAIVPGALAALRYMQMRNLLRAFVTHRPASTEPATHSWLREHALNRIPVVHVPREQGKHGALRSLRADVMIEDNPNEAHRLAEHGTSVILLDQPYNTALTHPLVLRAHGWGGVLALLKALPLDARAGRDKRGF